MGTRRSRGIEIRYARSMVAGTRRMMIVSERSPSTVSPGRWSDPSSRKFSGPARWTGPPPVVGWTREPGSSRSAWLTAELYRCASASPVTTVPAASRTSPVPAAISALAHSGAGCASSGGAGSARRHPVAVAQDEVVHRVGADRAQQLEAGLIQRLHVAQPGNRLGVELAAVGLDRHEVVATDVAHREDPVFQRDVAAVDDHRLTDDVEHVAQLARVGQHLAAQDLLEDRLDELLLVALPAVVAVGDPLALPDVVQCLPGGEVLVPDVVDLGVDPRNRVGVGGRVDPGRWLLLAGLGVVADVDRGSPLVDVHVDTAEDRDDLLETGEVDDRARLEVDVVVPLDRLLEHQEALLAGVQPGQALPAEGERAIDLVVAAPVLRLSVVERGNLGVGVARDGHKVGPVVGGRDVQDDDRVGAYEVGRVLVRSAVDADEQDVLRPVDRDVLRRSGGVQQVGLVDAADRGREDQPL